MEIRSGERGGIPSAPKQRQVLAMLLLNANKVTYVGDLSDELWGGRPPASMHTTLQTYVYQLRRRLEGPSRRTTIVTRPLGYMLNVPDGSIDVVEFQTKIEQAARCLEAEPEVAADLLESALRLWRGPALADVVCGTVLTGYVTQLDELKICATELLIEARMSTGHYRELVAELKRLVHMHPFHENFHAQLVRALSMSGRRQEAITAYRAVRSLLRSELGIDPSPCLDDALQLALHGPRWRETPRVGPVRQIRCG
ncbi:AfsR/SARP family transcriptional regulator [Amycolatopsis sp. QT-25]|uniref:AfsR/SARP family transcriptional regulator n=1 Tax=Amycolatopsis sp. QT-25 TaxID=3034022 RepID=UPI0023ECC603|nr:AfsR/SARP family transcriptional regulator [Amycolatopsis sp. QT-25]WET76803.1 AfsR/SARP family transcriptional regulator [Amycolatopsis sp. QT-25]